jgi:hypothetical protein
VTIDQSDQSTTRAVDPDRLAAAARSILSCPDEVHLVVDGIDDITDGLDAADPGQEPALGMQDIDGRPVFSCPPDAVLARAAADGRHALLTLSSGLGRPGSVDRDATLTLTGALETTGVEECECCAQERALVAVSPEFVVLTRSSDGFRVRVPLAEFGSPRHHLNRGFLQRSVEHANACHQEELRHAIAATSGTRLRDVGGVCLTDLRADQVELQWVDPTGAHATVLRFEHRARTTYELGELLRQELHAGLC